MFFANSSSSLSHCYKAAASCSAASSAGVYATGLRPSSSSSTFLFSSSSVPLPREERGSGRVSLIDVNNRNYSGSWSQARAVQVPETTTIVALRRRCLSKIIDHSSIHQFKRTFCSQIIPTTTITTSLILKRTSTSSHIFNTQPSNNFQIVIQRRYASKKTDKPKVAGWNKSLKVASKRQGKKYKMKTHKGAAQRWQVVSSSTAMGSLLNWKRAKCGRSHLRRKNRAWKKRSARERVLASPLQRSTLKKLIPYHAKKYSKV